MDDTVGAFLRSLRGDVDWPKLNAQVKAWDDGGNIELLARVAAELESEPTRQPQSSVVESVFADIVRILARGKTDDHLRALLAIARRPRLKKDARFEHLAALYVCLHDGERISAALRASSGIPELAGLRATLAAETVVRGKSGGVEREIEAAWAAMRASAHPLSTLPPQLTILERDLMVRNYGPDGGSGHSINFGPAPESCAPKTLRRREFGPTLVAHRVRDETRESRLRSAVQNWWEGSNGRIETGVWHCVSRSDQFALREEDLLNLKLECLAGTDEDAMTLKRIPAAEAFSLLFSAAATGGAYNSGEEGAYGRLTAWKSMAAFLRADRLDDLDALLRAAEAADWYTFCAENNWYYQVAWDLGIAALRHEHGELVVLAATDTD